MVSRQSEIKGKPLLSALMLLPAGLQVTGFQDFYVFHRLLDLACVTIAFSIFMITWYVREYREDGFLSFIGIFILFSGAMDVFHFLPYGQAGTAAEVDRNMSMQLWVAGRLIQGISFAASPFFIDRKVRAREILAIYSAMTLIAAASIFRLGIFPDCYVEGAGLTRFKTVCEYVIILSFAASIPLLILKGRRLDGNVLRMLIVSIGFFTVAEIIMAPLGVYSGNWFAAAQLASLAGYYFAYKAVIETGLSRPFDLLLRNVRAGEDALKKERDFISAVLDTAGALVIVLDGEGRILRFNKACECATGYPLSEARGRFAWEFFPDPAEAPVFRDYVRQPVARLAYKSMESWLVSKTGKRRLIDWTLAVLAAEDSRGGLVILSGIDITKRREAEEELRKSAERYRSLYHKTPVMLHSLDPAGRIVSVSEYWLDIMQYDRIGVIGRKFVEFLTESCRMHVEETVFPDFLEKGFCREANCEAVKKNGEKMDVLLSIEAERNDAGEIIRSLAVMVDITDRKRAQREIEELNRCLALRAEEIAEAYRQLEMLNNSLEGRLEEEVRKNRDKDFMLIQQSRLAAMGEMIGNIAHQWRQPLNAVSILVQDIEECFECGELDGDYLKNSVDQAKELIAHMSQTINDFRNFFKPDKELQRFSVKETIHRALNFVAGSFNDCNIRVEVSMENDVFVSGQPNEYSQVILNILNNAREACVERGVADARVAVSLRKDNDKSVVTIADNAGGIPEEIIGKVFDPYFSTKESGGTGIGLYMSKTIIEKNMKGRLSVKNGGSGAEFMIEV